MKYLLFILPVVAFITSCNGPSSIKTSSEDLVYTNGVYIALNHNVSAFNKQGDSLVPVTSIKILRFTGQKNGIIVPESINLNETIDTNKIRLYYNWCLDYEKKNPTDKDYIKIQPKFDQDTIRFSQKSPDSETLYKGVNYKDSIRMSYQMMHQGKLLPLRKELTFKFYKLY